MSSLAKNPGHRHHGFLGSGKTTLIRHLNDQRQRQEARGAGQRVSAARASMARF